MNTPWGQAQSQTTLAPGVVEVSTASHGGIHLNAERNVRVHEAWRASDGWYEEDCEWAIVAITFPEHFDAALIAQARNTAVNWFPDAYERAFGVRLSGADSFIRAEQEFHRANATRWVAGAAWGERAESHARSAIPAGMVGVAARRAGDTGADEQRWYLVPAGEYEARDRWFVVDEARHLPWPALPPDPEGGPVTVLVGAVNADGWPVYGVTAPHTGPLGILWRYPGRSGQPELWRAYRNGHGASLDAFPTRELALAAVGLRLAPVVAEHADPEDPQDTVGLHAARTADAPAGTVLARIRQALEDATEWNGDTFQKIGLIFADAGQPLTDLDEDADATGDGPPGDLAAHLSPAEIECALYTLAELWDGHDRDQDLSARQHEVAERLAELRRAADDG